MQMVTQLDWQNSETQGSTEQASCHTYLHDRYIRLTLTKVYISCVFIQQIQMKQKLRK